MSTEILALMIPIIAVISALIILPWMRMHYGAKKRERDGLDEGDRETLADLARIADKLERRIKTLERILDAEAPGWRTRNDG